MGNLESFLLFILIGAVAGWLAGVIMKGGGFGLLINIVVGVIGGFLGGWLFRVLKVNLFNGSIVGALIAAVVGAIVLLWVVSFFKRK